jgi:protein gp37
MSSKIEWLDGGSVWNPVTGCTKVSAGCANCYAERMSRRQMGPWRGRKFTDVRCHQDRLVKPLDWKKPRKVFVNSMSDLFHEVVPWDFINKAWGMMTVASQHTFIVLTKRPARMLEFFTGKHYPYPAADGPDKPRPNIWLGVSVEDQATADERIPLLLQTPAAVRVVSAEPLLGPVDLTSVMLPDELAERARLSSAHVNCLTRSDDEHFYNVHEQVDWVIVGGESGPGARPCNVEWIRSIVGQCKAASVPVFVKQMGARPAIRMPSGKTLKDAFNDDLAACSEWPQGIHFGTHCGGEEWRGRGVLLRNPKGGDMAEWPEDLRVRQWPEIKG